MPDGQIRWSRLANWAGQHRSAQSTTEAGGQPSRWLERWEESWYTRSGTILSIPSDKKNVSEPAFPHTKIAVITVVVPGHDLFISKMC